MFLMGMLLVSVILPLLFLFNFFVLSHVPSHYSPSISFPPGLVGILSIGITGIPPLELLLGGVYLKGGRPDLASRHTSSCLSLSYVCS